MPAVIVIPPLFNGLRAKGFFTTKAAGIDRNAVAKIAGVRTADVYMPVQQHTDKVLCIDFDLDPKIADGVITKRQGILIGVQVADCVPILLYDKKKQVTGAVHAGWRGTSGGILKIALMTMMEKFCSSAPDILIAIGPSIKSCCYEVGHEVAAAVEKTSGGTDYSARKGEKYFIDLPSANKHQAFSLGIPPENIWLSGECTSCRPEKYSSYRFEKGAAGRQGGFIGIV